MIVVQGKQISNLTASQLGERIASYAGVTMDIGTGDGRFAYDYARQHPERYIIGIDPVRENMREFSARAARKPGRGGLPNVLYAVASIERLPAELAVVADEVFVTLPWGSLMRGIVLGDDVVLAGLASPARPGAVLRIVLNTRIFDDPVPVEARDLPEVTPAYARETLAPAFARHGMVIREARFMDADEVARLPTTWAKRLSHRAPPPSVYIKAVVQRRS